MYSPPNMIRDYHSDLKDVKDPTTELSGCRRPEATEHSEGAQGRMQSGAAPCCLAFGRGSISENNGEICTKLVAFVEAWRTGAIFILEVKIPRSRQRQAQDDI
jgi:hypothetical protein